MRVLVDWIDQDHNGVVELDELLEKVLSRRRLGLIEWLAAD